MAATDAFASAIDKTCKSLSVKCSTEALTKASHAIERPSTVVDVSDDADDASQVAAVLVAAVLVAAVLVAAVLVDAVLVDAVLVAASQVAAVLVAAGLTSACCCACVSCWLSLLCSLTSFSCCLSCC